MRIAILGGSFDPVHNGHLQIAKYAKKCLPIDEVWFMPTYDTPLKDKRLTDFELRVKMIRLAIKPYKYMKVCTMENERVGKSYTIDTVKKLHQTYPHHFFSWLIGSDQALQLSKWRSIDSLMELIPFYVFTRNKEEIKTAHPLRFLTMPIVDVSSTQIRNGEKLWMLPRSIRQFIGKHGLYLEHMIRTTMNEHRYKHSLSVAQLCVELAKMHHINEKEAYLAGLYHDVCKQWSKEKAMIWMEHMEPSLLHEHPNIWHGYIASTYVKRFYTMKNKKVLYAIRHHVKGSTKTTLAKIVYIADKLDPTRGYDSSTTIELCKRDLNEGYQEVMRQQQAYLEKSFSKGASNE